MNVLESVSIHIWAYIILPCRLPWNPKPLGCRGKLSSIGQFSRSMLVCGRVIILIPRHSMYAIGLPISWDGLGGQWAGIHGSPVECLGYICQLAMSATSHSQGCRALPFVRRPFRDSRHRRKKAAWSAGSDTLVGVL